MTPYNTRHLIANAPCSGSFDFSGKRLCTRCRQRVPMRGGKTHNGSRFVCANCRAKTEGAK